MFVVDKNNAPHRWFEEPWTLRRYKFVVTTYLWRCRLYVGLLPINKMIETTAAIPSPQVVVNVLTISSHSLSLSLSLFTHIATILSNNKMGTGQYRVHKLLMFFDYLHTYCYNLSASFPSWARFWVRIIPRLPFIYLFIVLLVTSTLGFPLCLTFSRLVVWLFLSWLFETSQNLLGSCPPRTLTNLLL